ncbi:MAG: asparagine synthase C-terminal domain-containing protein [Deltaproteobacteria bacterium]|nr:asparagine synthase C-terminal domain-containing protein [Deltaproteobacteria bacterium]
MMHLRSDVPLGAALSGGIDSSSIVMAMRHRQGPGLDINTFSFVSEDQAFNEEKWAELIGRAAGAKIHKVFPLAEELLTDLDDLIKIQDEPFASLSIYAQYRVMRLVRTNNIKVILDGQGADEMLGGYPAYKSARLSSLLGRFQFRRALTFALQVSSTVPWSVLLRQTGSYFLPTSFHSLARRLAKVEFFPEWMNVEWFGQRQIRPAAGGNQHEKIGLTHELYQSLLHRGLAALLRHEDRNSMAFSIESRVPFLTPQLASFLLSLPEEYIIDSKGVSKSIFRLAMHGLVPDKILDRQDKIGFVTPDGRWLSVMQPWVEKVLAENRFESTGPLNLSVFRREWQDFLSGQKAYRADLWRGLNFLRWAELYDLQLD